MSLCRSVDRSGGSIEFSRHVAVSIALNLSSFIYPPLVLDIAITLILCQHTLRNDLLCN